VREISENIFWENPYTRSPANQNYSQPLKNTDKTPTYSQFSDVIAIAGNRGLPAGFFALFYLKSMPKKQSP